MHGNSNIKVTSIVSLLSVRCVQDIPCLLDSILPCTSLKYLLHNNWVMTAHYNPCYIEHKGDELPARYQWELATLT